MTRLPAVPILLALASSASAATLQVPADFPAMAGALAVASSGDTVLVSPGTYLEHDLVLPSGVVLLGDAATPEYVVIDAAGQGRVLFGDGLAAGTEIGMLTLQGGATSGNGGGAILSGSFLLRDCVIEDCSADGLGGGLRLQRGEVRRCDFRDNHAGAGGGLAIGNSDTAHVEDCVFAGNTATIGGAAASTGFLTLVYCTLAFNTADRGGAVFYGGDSEIQARTLLDRCLVAFNMAASGSGGIDGWYSVGEAPHIDFDCSDVFGNTPTEIVGGFPMADLIYSDPQFCPGAGEGRYPIADGSPCAPANSPCGERIGAFDPACASTAVERRSWGAVKSLY